MTEEQIKHMINRFLAWKLPEDFQPDAGIKYDKSKHHPNHPPVGTNLLTATQAEEMIRHLVEGLPTQGEKDE